MDRRSFHLHVHQHAATGEVTWSVTRTLWRSREKSRSAILASGSLPQRREGQTVQESAGIHLEDALQAFGEWLRTSG